MKIEYDCDVGNIPDSILVIPFICNILPMAWLCDAEVVVDEIDKDFYDNVPYIKKGYEQMYPMLEFGGRINAKRITHNQVKNQNKTAAFFSGGVDAYTTLFRHLDEKPCLVTVWGADISLSDTEGWKNVIGHTQKVADEYHLDCEMIKTNFRELIDEGKLGKLVKKSGDGWWHGFQSGMGIISHVAPIAYARGLKTVYIASSYPKAMKGRYTCASDPTIDNHVIYCGCKTLNDGNEMDRQQKVRFLVGKRKEGLSMNFRVCWEISGGKNCCRCEKCYRTILEIVAECDDPNKYGFVWDDKAIRACKKDMKRKIVVTPAQIEQLYLPLPEIMERNKENIKDYEKYRWLVNMDFAKFNNFPFKVIRRSFPIRAMKKVCRVIYQRGIKR